MKVVLWSLVFVLLLTDSTWSIQPSEKQTLGVINFTPQEVNGAEGKPRTPDTATTLTVLSPLAKSSDQAWLSKAIADLLIKNLAEVRTLAILERERMQAFSDEIDLGGSALFNQDKALRVGRVAKVQQMIFGNYLLRGDQITLQVQLLDLGSQQILRRERAIGSLQDLGKLVGQLVLRLLAKQDIPLSDQEKRNIASRHSDSISATEHFYRAIDFYDRGAYSEAFGEFVAASRQDPNYLEARLWMGRIFEYLGYYRHAAQAYSDLFDRAPRSVEGLDALFFAAQVFESHLADHQKAIEVYQEIALRAPGTPHALEASFQLGNILYKAGRIREAYEAFGKVDSFREKVLQNPAVMNTKRKSRFVTWRHALDLHRDAIVQMICLYEKMIHEGLDSDETQLPPPPRGLVVLDALHPNAHGRHLDHRPAIFKEIHETQEWRERLYAFAVPKGYVAIGVDFSITGQLLEMRPFHSYTMRILPFPLPREFDQRWLGAIFGQTPRRTTLHKSVSFHGENRRIFSVQLLESRSRIDNWNIHVHLCRQDEVKTSAIPAVGDDGNAFWEGMPFAILDLPEIKDQGATRTTAQSYYRPKKELDVLYAPGNGYFLATTVGQLDGRHTDLWVSQSHDGKQWTELAPFSANSSSQEFNPRLLYSELGRVWLSWISTRRGAGWELWMAQVGEGATERHPRRVPFEKFIRHERVDEASVTDGLLEYDLHQDRSGRWTAVCYSTRAKRVIFLRSSDLKHWELLADVPLGQTAYGLSLTQDSSGIYRLGYLGQNGNIHLWHSIDGRSWKKRRFAIRFWNQSFFPTPGSHRMRLFPLPNSRLLMLVSDNQYGLQVARFSADSEEPLLDLVSRAGLEPYGVTHVPADNQTTDTDAYLVALKESGRITIRKYKSFNVNGKAIEKDTRNWPIYMETEQDEHKNTWHRIFAQARVRVSDVTALGADSDGRIWWGIESGIMYKQGEQFLATDVSQGFFYHLVTHITSTSGGRVWFSSKFLNEPTLGHIRRPRPIAQTLASGRPPRFLTVRVPEIQGAITDTTRGKQNSEIYLGTSEGRVVGFDGTNLFFSRSFESPITAVKFDPATNDLWVGTQRNGLYRIDPNGMSHHDPSNGLLSGKILAIELDARGFPWVAVRGQGLFQYQSQRHNPTTWQRYCPENSNILYWNIGRLVADTHAGVWYLPDGDERSRGLGYFDGRKIEVYNPPHRILEKPSSMVIDEKGDIWIGTWFDGLYRLERKKQTP